MMVENAESILNIQVIKYTMIANLCTFDNTEIFSAEKGQSSSNSQYSLHHSQITLQEHRHQTGSPERKNEKGN